jgi:hypothetical protein
VLIFSAKNYDIPAYKTIFFLNNGTANGCYIAFNFALDNDVTAKNQNAFDFFFYNNRLSKSKNFSVFSKSFFCLSMV